MVKEWKAGLLRRLKRDSIQSDTGLFVSSRP